MVAEQILERFQQVGFVANGPGKGFPGETKSDEGANGFTDVPLDGMKAIAAVGDVGDAEVLAGGQEVVRALGTQDGLYYHHKMLEAVKARDQKLAVALMEEHIVRTIERLKEAWKR